MCGADLDTCVVLMWTRVRCPGGYGRADWHARGGAGVGGGAPPPRRSAGDVAAQSAAHLALL